MKKILLVLLLVHWNAHAVVKAGYKMCDLVMSKYISRSAKDDLTRNKWINRMEDIREYFMRGKVTDDVVEVNRIIKEELAEIDTKLLKGEYAYANRKMRGVFKKVEVAHVFIKNQEVLNIEIRKMMDQIENFDDFARHFTEKASKNGFEEDFITKHLDSFESVKKYLKKTDKQIRSQSQLIGNHYHRYKMYRGHLEWMSKNGNCDIACKDNVKRLFDSLGVGSSNERLHFGGLLKGQTRPSQKAISEAFHSNPIAYETRLFKESMHEAKAYLRDVFTNKNLREKFVRFLNLKLPNKGLTGKIKNMLSDTNARINHFPRINSVVRTDGGTAQKYYRLKEVNAQILEDDELLTTMRRRVDQGATEGWESVKEYARQNDEIFFQKMVKAEEEAIARGPISLDKPKSRSAVTAIFLASAGTFYTYFKFSVDGDGDETEVEPIIIDGTPDDSGVDIDNGSHTIIVHGPEEAQTIYQETQELHSIIDSAKAEGIHP